MLLDHQSLDSMKIEILKLKSLKLNLKEFIFQNKENLSRNNLLKIAKSLTSKLNKARTIPPCLNSWRHYLLEYKRK